MVDSSLPHLPTPNQRGKEHLRLSGFERAWPLALATALGLTLLLAVGFAPGLAHNAAHDVRHSMAFPCH